MESAVMGLVTPDQYQEKRQHMFPSDTSLTWYIRRHRPALVRCGAVMIINRRVWLDAQLLDDYVVKAGRESAAQRLAEAA